MEQDTTEQNQLPPSIFEKYKIGPQYYKQIYSEFSILGKILFIFQVVIGIIQEIVGITMLAISWNTPALQLQLVSILYLSQLFLVLIFCPLYFSIGQPTHEIPEYIEREKLRKNFRGKIDWALFVPFLLAFVLVFGPNAKDLSNQSPIMYNTCLGFIIFGLSRIFSPALLACLAILCLPCLFLLLRNADLREEARIRAMGASDDLIASLPIYRFRKRDVEDPVELSTTPPPPQLPFSVAVPSPLARTVEIPERPSSPTPGSPTTPSSPKKKNTKKKRRFKFFFKKKEVEEPPEHDPQEPEIFYLELNEEDATCSICLCEYENDENLRQLGCKHHFHQTCIDEWLHLNAKCPLCVQNIEETMKK
ncbi:hypothetical protein HDV06_004464 [Boothiomyces sp. JEL0866]|nr:hypothetical protein HDV06_004464 [Boothiomyces sp. JEL0866]